MVEKNPYWKRTFSKQRVDGWFDGKQQGRKKDIGERELLGAIYGVTLVSSLKTSFLGLLCYRIFLNAYNPIVSNLFGKDTN